ATYLVRDLVTTPAEDMGPAQLADAARALGRRHKATVRVTTGDQLLKQNYPAIHAVGRASDDPPRLIDLSWGATKDPKVTLVGKGVCFDTGGLDLKGAAGMLLMKKDMGGAAHVLGLASMIMDAKLPVRLRVLIPAVENAVAGNAYHPMDVLTMRNGMTVEVGNTDAEGRLVLADCLVRACEEKPALLIDYATLTGAARVALGPELPALFTNDDTLAHDLGEIGRNNADPVWRLPLHRDYRRMLDSAIADISSTGSGGLAGAITAALFLAEFVDEDIPWVHFDVMAWNPRSRPGRPEGGEAMGLRTVYAAIAQRFGKATARKTAKPKTSGKKPRK
ncbi:MAG: leucyl aminopeptidase family protein, partial [Alphaproteobacteria bacterium]